MISHAMAVAAETRQGVVFECPTCGRKVLIGKPGHPLTVIIKGDFDAEHSGSRAGVGLTVASQVQP